MGRLLDDVWDEDALLEQLEVYAGLVQTAEMATEESTTSVDKLNDWIVERRGVIEQYIADGGVEGEPGELSCYDAAGMEGNELNDAGELVTTLGHSCATLNSIENSGWLALMTILGWSRRRSFHRKLED